MGKHPKISIIILNWNGRELLNDCLSSLFKLTDYPNYKVIVVDNGSVDGSVEFVKKSFPKADVLALDKNYGFSRGNNEGIKFAFKKYSPKYIFLLNNDTEIIQKGWLTKMVDVAESDNRIGLVGCKLLFPDGRIQYAGIMSLSSIFSHRGWGQEDRLGMFDKIEEVGAATGAAVLIKKSLMEKIGLLDEKFSFSCEDSDYCIKTMKAGFRTMYVGSVKLIHKGSATSKGYFHRHIIHSKSAIRFHLRYHRLIDWKSSIKALFYMFRRLQKI